MRLFLKENSNNNTYQERKNPFQNIEFSLLDICCGGHLVFNGFNILLNKGDFLANSCELFLGHIFKFRKFLTNRAIKFRSSLICRVLKVSNSIAYRVLEGSDLLFSCKFTQVIFTTIHNSLNNFTGLFFRDTYSTQPFYSVIRIKISHHKLFLSYICIIKQKINNLKKIALFGFLLILPIAEAQAQRCTGRFVNPINDICWECLFPITIGSFEIVGSDNPDTENPDSPVCICPGKIAGLPQIGIAGGFWEPARLVDVTKRPYCFPSIGGIKIDVGIKIGTGDASKSDGKGGGSWHVHWYIYPLIYWLELLTDFLCLEQMNFDIAYITELDPLWQDDALTFILNPEAILFANPIAQAACMADCAAATGGLPMDSLFWCAGCQGGMYPLNGRIQAHIGSVQSALLAAERMTYKLHRELLAWGTSGSTNDEICEKYPMPIMKKSQYRSQLVVPVPSDCYPYGRTTTIYESGKEVPISGEDFGFLIWRKKNCCLL